MSGYRERVIYDGILEVYRDTWEIHYRNDAPRRSDGQFDLRFSPGGRSLKPEEVEIYASHLRELWDEAEQVIARVGSAPGDLKKLLSRGRAEALISQGRLVLRIPEVCYLQSREEADRLALAFRDIIACIPELQTTVRAVYGP